MKNNEIIWESQNAPETKQTVRMQLLHFMNHALEQWWICFGKDYEDLEGITMDMSGYYYMGYNIRPHTVHEIFSQESGLMEYSKRDKYVDKDLKVGDEYIQGTSPEYHYMIMSTMSGEQKVQYFIHNAQLPSA